MCWGLGRWWQRRGRANLRMRSIDRLRLGIPSSVQGDPCSCLCLCLGINQSGAAFDHNKKAQERQRRDGTVARRPV